ncbi:MAG TPA: hypothetical protein VNO54_06725 [Streptosporangiaceae bacterium]|nr:hypothetical protein [Streptosporangiaceae bacterium]
MGDPLEEGAGGFNLAVFGAISASLDRVASMMQDREVRQGRLFDALHQVQIGPQQIPLVAGAGTLVQVENFGPKAGFMWSIRRLTASGFTAGSVTAWKNGTAIAGTIVGGEPLVPFASAGVNTSGRGDVLLDQNDYLTFSATGITGLVQINGAADNFERWLLPDYLG